MDVTKRYSIAYKGLKDGIHTFDFQVDEELFKAYDSKDIKGGSCNAHVELKRSETMLETHTSITGSVVTECDRCLEDCDIPIHFEGELLVKFSDKVDDYDGEVLWLSPSAAELDLTQYIYESIVLALPYRRVHPDGACDLEMLNRLKIISEEEFSALEQRTQAEQDAQSRESQSGQWAKLEALKQEMLREEDKHEDKK